MKITPRVNEESFVGRPTYSTIMWLLKEYKYFIGVDLEWKRSLWNKSTLIGDYHVYLTYILGKDFYMLRFIMEMPTRKFGDQTRNGAESSVQVLCGLSSTNYHIRNAYGCLRNIKKIVLWLTHIRHFSSWHCVFDNKMEIKILSKCLFVGVWPW